MRYATLVAKPAEIQKLLVRRGWSWTELGRQARFSAPTISKIRHSRPVAVATLKKAAEILDVAVAKIADVETAARVPEQFDEEAIFDVKKVG